MWFLSPIWLHDKYCSISESGSGEENLHNFQLLGFILANSFPMEDQSNLYKSESLFPKNNPY